MCIVCLREPFALAISVLDHYCGGLASNFIEAAKFGLSDLKLNSQINLSFQSISCIANCDVRKKVPLCFFWVKCHIATRLPCVKFWPVGMFTARFLNFLNRLAVLMTHMSVDIVMMTDFSPLMAWIIVVSQTYLTSDPTFINTANTIEYIGALLAIWMLCFVILTVDLSIYYTINYHCQCCLETHIGM